MRRIVSLVRLTNRRAVHLAPTRAPAGRCARGAVGRRRRAAGRAPRGDGVACARRRRARARAFDALTIPAPDGAVGAGEEARAGRNPSSALRWPAGRARTIGCSCCARRTRRGAAVRRGGAALGTRSARSASGAATRRRRAATRRRAAERWRRASVCARAAIAWRCSRRNATRPAAPAGGEAE